MVLFVHHKLAAPYRWVIRECRQGLVQYGAKLQSRFYTGKIAQQVNLFCGVHFNARQKAQAVYLARGLCCGQVAGGIVVGHGYHICPGQLGHAHGHGGGKGIVCAGGKAGVDVKVAPQRAHACGSGRPSFAAAR